ncbi:type III polyketide synthase [Streptomyces phaeochromogenes]
MLHATIRNITFRTPPLAKTEALADLTAGDPGGADVGRVIGNSAIDTKGTAVHAPVEDPRHWTTRKRMDRSLTEARALGLCTVTDALRSTGLDPGDIGLFATVTTTTHSAPGLDSLAHELGLRRNVQILSLGPMGCYAALPALSLCADWVAVHRRPAVLLAVDLFSPHMQPPPYDKESAVVLTLFGDGAAAVVLFPSGSGGSGGSDVFHGTGTAVGDTREAGRRGIDVVDTEQLTCPEHADDLQVHLGDRGMRIRLAPTMPDVVASSVAVPARALLDRHGIAWDDVDWWAVHPGGRRILDRVEEALALPSESVDAARASMRAHGNTAAPAVLAVLRDLQESRPLAPGRHGVALAFGPGATIWAMLLRG